MATQLMKADPDGYTIGMGASAAYTLTPQLNKKIKYKIGDFQHIRHTDLSFRRNRRQSG